MTAWRSWRTGASWKREASWTSSRIRRQRVTKSFIASTSTTDRIYDLIEEGHALTELGEDEVIVSLKYDATNAITGADLGDLKNIRRGLQHHLRQHRSGQGYPDRYADRRTEREIRKNGKRRLPVMQAPRRGNGGNQAMIEILSTQWAPHLVEIVSTVCGLHRPDADRCSLIVGSISLIVRR